MPIFTEEEQNRYFIKEIKLVRAARAGNLLDGSLPPLLKFWEEKRIKCLRKGTK